MSEQQSEREAITVDSIRAAGGIVYCDGEIKFTSIEQLRAALSKPSTKWTHEINQELERQYLKGFQAGKAFAVSTPGWKLVPIEPQSAMLDRAVAFALNVKLSSDYRWTDYMKDLWATMLAGSPPPPIEPREEKL